MAEVVKLSEQVRESINFDASGLSFYNPLAEPFRVYGLIPPTEEGERYKRMPTEVATTVNECVAWLHYNTAGGRIRFCTNSTRVAIAVQMQMVCRMDHFTLTGSAGFDLYVGNKYVQTFRPPATLSDGDCYSAVLDIGDSHGETVEINFPLYSDVVSVSIGLDKDAEIFPAEPYKYEKPVVYYGSSVTQGGCASRPGNAYQAIISRRLNCNHVNLGFSGSAKGEVAIAEYIASLDMQVYVSDYDYNAPSVEHLQNTHQRMFQIIRQKQPELPIVLVTSPKYYPKDFSEERREIIRATYEAARAQGDKNVYFVDGHKMMHDFADDGGTVDAIHPNDYGFVAMAKGIGNVLAEILK